MEWWSKDTGPMHPVGCKSIYSCGICSPAFLELLIMRKLEAASDAPGTVGNVNYVVCHSEG